MIGEEGEGEDDEFCLGYVEFKEAERYSAAGVWEAVSWLCESEAEERGLPEIMWTANCRGPEPELDGLSLRECVEGEDPGILVSL